MKKLFATVLALVMMLSVMSVTAFAADSTTYTVSVPSTDKHTYAVYQIFTGDLSKDGVLSNTKWGKNGTGTEGEAVDAAVLTALEAVAKSESNPEKLAVINQYVNLESSAVATLTAGQSYKAAPGYYLIKDAGTVDKDDAYTTYIVQIVDNVEITRKADVPKVDKEILDPTETKTNEASIGDKVNYQITGTLPSNLDDYNTYYYQFVDTMSKGLTYNKDMKVKIGDNDVTKYFHVGETANSDGSTTVKVTIADLLALNNAGVTVDKDTKIVLTYSATLNKDAVIAGEGNPNDVTLKYSNNPNDSGKPSTEPPTPPEEEPESKNPTGETPKSEVKTYTTELTITKTDGKDILTGAEFELTGDGVNVVITKGQVFTEATDGTYWKLKDGSYTMQNPNEEGMDQTKYESTTVKYKMETKVVCDTKGTTPVAAKAFVDENGKLTFTGLGAGTYTLKETTTPAGYNTCAPIKFTIGFSVDGNKNVTFTSDNENVVVGDATNTLTTTVVNQKGSTLPETGGIGTTIFYAAGGVLLAGAAVMLVAKKRMEAED